MTGIRERAFALGRAVDRRGGSARRLVRFGFGAARSVRDTVRDRRLVTLSWSERDGRWHHRWPEGHVVDVHWWRNAHAWATDGGMHEMDDLLWRHYRPQPGDVVVDIGAGHGGETFYLAPMVGPTGRVVAVEAAPRPYRRLVELTEVNDWPQVEPVQAAITDRTGVVTMADTDSWVTANVFESGSIEVPSLTLDELCQSRRIDRIDWLKMNIEGAEREAVRGMERMASHIRHLTISCHDFLGTDWGRSREEVTSWLTAHGFSVWAHGPGEPWEVDYLYASRDAAGGRSGVLAPGSPAVPEGPR